MYSWQLLDTNCIVSLITFIWIHIRTLVNPSRHETLPMDEADLDKPCENPTFSLVSDDEDFDNNNVNLSEDDDELAIVHQDSSSDDEEVIDISSGEEPLQIVISSDEEDKVEEKKRRRNNCTFSSSKQKTYNCLSIFIVIITAFLPRFNTRN